MAQPWHRGPHPKLRLAVLNAAGWRCQIQAPGCTGHATHADHIISPLDGGTWHDPNNLRASCPHCNLTRPNPHKHPPRTYTPSRNW